MLAAFPKLGFGRCTEIAHSFVDPIGLRHSFPPLDLVWHKEGKGRNRLDADMTDQSGNLFEFGSNQLGLDLGDAPKRKSYEPDREEVRQELHEILAQAKAAHDHCPWDERTFMYHKVVFPQMANWLPEDERDQLRFEFAEEVSRIELLMAA